MQTLLVAACAMIDIDGRVLLGKRPAGKTLAGLWEFPGGKVEPGETPEACLIRELDEELGVKITHACLAPFVFASHGLGDRPPPHAAVPVPQVGGLPPRPGARGPGLGAA